MVYIALLRGVNVGGNKKAPMAELRKMATDLGYKNAQTWLQSGNLLFESSESPTPELESHLKMETEKRLGLQTEYIVRTPDRLQAAIDSNPFIEEAKSDPSHLLVMFLNGAPTEENVQALREAIKGREVVQAVANHLYMVYPDGIGDSKLTISIIERKLGSHGTARNWNTVLKLASLAGF